MVIKIFNKLYSVLSYNEKLDIICFVKSYISCPVESLQYRPLFLPGDFLTKRIFCHLILELRGVYQRWAK
jgi:hypothetical protein